MRSHERSSWRRFSERPSLRALRTVSALDEEAIYAGVDQAIRRNDQLMTALRAKMAYEQAVQTASARFKEEAMLVCATHVHKRDARVLEALGKYESKWREGFHAAQQLGLLHPAWLEYRKLDFMSALTQLAEGSQASQFFRQHKIMQAAVREVGHRKQLMQRIPPSAMAQPALARPLLGEAEVRRLRAGEALVIDAQLIGIEQMRRVQADLSRLVKGMAVASDAPCNTGAQTSFLPLLQPEADDGFNMTSDTRAVLQLLAALPAEIERHGWPRPLSLPAFVQLAEYSARTRARYTPHLDRYDYETHNRREITILLYVNVGWDSSRCGGCLRLHPTPMGSAPTRDVDPVAGRLVLFPSATQMHEVLPATEGERLALTLWVDYADGEQKAN
jgi:hypothetical protein